MGLSSKEFYDLTPRQFDAMVRAHHRAKHRSAEHAEFLFGQLTAMVANTGSRGWETVRTAEEFMPSRRAEIDAEELAAERMRCTMTSFAAFQNARVARSEGS